MGFPGGSDSKESTGNTGDLGSIPWLGRSPGGWHGNPLQYSCLENPYGWESDMTERLSTTQHMTIDRPMEPSRKISRGKIPWSPSLLLVISTRIPLPLTKPNRKPDSKRIIEPMHTGQLPRAQRRAEMSTDDSGGQMIEINVEDYVMVKLYHNNNNNTMKQKKTNSRLVDSWSLTGLLT